jgi:hypothetical protein
MTTDLRKKTRLTAVWHVEYVDSGEPAVCVYRTYREAKDAAEWLESMRMPCVHVVGPNMHEVPA